MNTAALRVGRMRAAGTRALAWLSRPWVAVSCLALCFALAAGWDNGKRPFEIYDEPLTAERSREMLVTGDWLAVQVSFHPDFKKPPLHYWLTAGALAVMEDRMAAVRLWSLLFGAGSILGVAWVARELLGREARWGILFPVLFYLGCSHLWRSSGAALLDTGMAFFSLAGVGCVLRARGDPRWWLGWGAACALGALHKAGLALLFGPAMVVGLWPAFAATRFWRRPAFWAGAGIAMAGLTLWPMVQSLRFGPEMLNTFVGSEIVGRVVEHEERGAFSRPWYAFLDLAWAWPVTGVVGVAWLAAGWHSKFRRWAPREQLALWLAAAAMALLLTAMAKKSHRYGLSMVPWVALGLGVPAALLPWRRAKMIMLAAAALLVPVSPLFPSIGPPYPNARGAKFRKGLVKFLQRERRPGEIVVLGAVKSELRNAFMQRLQFEADVDAPILHAPPASAGEVLGQARGSGAVLIVSEAGARDALLAAAPGEPVAAFDDWVYWRAPASGR